MIEFAYGTAHGFSIIMGIVVFGFGVVTLTSAADSPVRAQRRRLVVLGASLLCLAAFSWTLAMAAQGAPNPLADGLGFVLAFAVTVATVKPLRTLLRAMLFTRAPASA